MEIIGIKGEPDTYGVYSWGYRLLFVPKDGKSRRWVVTDGDRDRFRLNPGGPFYDFKKKDLEGLGYSWVIDSGETAPSYYGEGEVFESEKKFTEISQKRNLREKVNTLVERFFEGGINKNFFIQKLEELL
jgi:hypothetical protein